MENQDYSRIKEIIKDIHQLPTLPAIYSRLNKMIANPKSTARSISQIIEEDQALTTKILRIINSAFYSFPQKVSSISHAVVILGFSEIKNIALAASVIDLFQNGGDTYCFKHEAFWEHSLAVAVCSRIIAKKVGVKKIKDSEEAFTSGLIHDIGKLIEDQFMHNEFIEVMKMCNEEDVPLIKAEKKIIGVTHQEVGKFLAEKWKLPANLVEIIGGHNTPDLESSGDKSYILSVIHLANIIVHVLEIGFSGDPFVPPLDKKCWQCLELSKDDLSDIMEETEKGYEEVTGLMK